MKALPDISLCNEGPQLLTSAPASYIDNGDVKSDYQRALEGTKRTHGEGE